MRSSGRRLPPRQRTVAVGRGQPVEKGMIGLWRGAGPADGKAATPPDSPSIGDVAVTCGSEFARPSPVRGLSKPWAGCAGAVISATTAPVAATSVPDGSVAEIRATRRWYPWRMHTYRVEHRTEDGTAVVAR